MLSSTDLDSEVKELTARYESDARELSDDGKKERLREIQDKFDKMKEYSEDKVQLTVQMYEMVSIQYIAINKQEYMLLCSHVYAAVGLMHFVLLYRSFGRQVCVLYFALLFVG